MTDAHCSSDTDRQPQSYPYPNELRGMAEESEYRDWLVSIFNRFGWETATEVISDNKSSRADIIIKHEFWGTIGIECKYGKITPSIWANALKQVLRYSERTFNGDKVQNWVLAVDYDQHPFDEFHQRKRTQMAGYHEFMNAFGMGVLRTNTRMELVFNNSNPMVKIPICSVSYPDGELEPPDFRRFEDTYTEAAKQYLQSGTEN